MDNITHETTLMKVRSTGGATATGYRLYNGNFKKLFRSSWIQSLLYALVCGALGVLVAVKSPELSVMAITSAPTEAMYHYAVGLSVAILALSAAAFLLETVFYACSISLLRQHSLSGIISRPLHWYSFDKHATWRTLKGVLGMVAIACVPAIVFSLLWQFRLKSAISSPGDNIVLLSFSIIAAILVFLAYLPCHLGFMKYVINDGCRFWPTVAKEYPVALRHYGMVFGVCLLSSIVVIIIEFVIILPALIIAIANYHANMGVINGDPLGMPSYIMPLTAVVMAIAGFFQAYIRSTMLFTLYYMYGSIESQEQERNDYISKKSESEHNETNIIHRP